MASRKDYYDILGIARGATAEEIEKAYRKLTRTYQLHPFPGNKKAETRFREISKAYEILSNKEKRERYDRAGSEPPFPDLEWEYDPGEEEDDNFYLEGFEDILMSYSRMGEQAQAASRQPQKGRDVYCPLEIEFKEAVLGAMKKVQVLREITCSGCSGRGMDLMGPQKACVACGGAGQILVGLPPSAFSQICSHCQGAGKLPTQLCGVCSGKGILSKEEDVLFQIPAGVDDGCRIYLKGRGQAGKNGGPRGDLVLQVKVPKHPYFQRRGDDLHVEIPLAIWEAVLGGEVEIPTIDGLVKLTIPPNLPEGERLFLRKKGVPYLQGSGRGDQIISFRVVVPQDLDPRSKEILRELRQLSTSDPRKKCGWRFPL